MTAPPRNRPVVRELDDRYQLDSGPVVLTGIQAIVRAVLEQIATDARAGRRVAGFISGYQGSPLGGLDLELKSQRDRLTEAGIIHRPAVNEELAATSVMGTQLARNVGTLRYDGIVGFWYGKAPGLDRASDALRHANLVGTDPRGGAVALIGDDATAKSSTVPSSSELALFDLGMPILVPGDVGEIIPMLQHAVAMSRVSGLWSAVKLATPVADSSGTVSTKPLAQELPDSSEERRRLPHNRLIGPPLLELEQSLGSTRLSAARDYGRRHGLNRVTVRHDDDKLGVVAVGRMYYELSQALRDLGIREQDLATLGVRLLHVGMPFPLEAQQIQGFCDGIEEVVIIEEKREFVETFVKDMLYAQPQRPRVVGKCDENGDVALPRSGDFTATEIAQVLGGRLAARADGPRLRQRLAELDAPRPVAPLPLVRTPYFCSGCPHSTSMRTPEGTVVGGGIGCHGLAMVMSPAQVGEVTGVTAMGTEGAQWIGIAPFVDSGPIVQNIGDGTFLHSGSLAVRAAKAAGIDITFKLLFNSAVAMTGGQQPAGGGLSVPKICASLLAEGVQQIIVTTDEPDRYHRGTLPDGVMLWNRSRIVEAQEHLAQIAGVKVLIHDQECATEQRRKRKRGTLPDPAKRIFINDRVCEGCGDCGAKSNCLSVVPVDTEFGRKTTIHQASCNKDYSCVEGDCPSFLEVIPSGPRRSRPKITLQASDLPSPAVDTSREVTIRIVGVGGTGVVTTARIIGMAAHLDGKQVRGLDQIGLAQKGGPVVSDIRVFNEDAPVASHATVGECDVYLGCDLLGAADAKNLAVASSHRTTAVVSDSQIATGQMIVDPDVRFPDSARLTHRVERRARESLFFDAQGDAVTLFGVDQLANQMLLGAGYQLGALPISSRSVERAIELNGTTVNDNLQAFLRGRQRVADPEAYARAVGDMRALPALAAPALSDDAHEVIDRLDLSPEDGLGRLVGRRYDELVAYQNDRWAQLYADELDYVRKRETTRLMGHSQLLRAAAENLFKLMAYKDEAEVARLQLDPRLRAQIEADFGEGARYRWKLHPPLLRALGLKHKLTFGAWFAHVYRVLYAMRHLRGTRFDPFGYAHVRKVERALIVEYRGVLKKVAANVTARTEELSVEILNLPDMIRGYDDVKLANVDRYRQRLEELLVQFDRRNRAEAMADA